MQSKFHPDVKKDEKRLGIDLAASMRRSIRHANITPDPGGSHSLTAGKAEGMAPMRTIGTLHLPAKPAELPSPPA